MLKHLTHQKVLLWGISRVMSKGKNVFPRIKWTAERKEWLYNYSLGHTSKEVAEEFFNTFGLRLTSSAVQAACNRYNFSGRLKNTGMFVKGLIPHNLGKKMSEVTKNKLVASGNPLFAKGANRTKYTERPLYSERVDRDGYTYVKVPYNSLCLKQRNTDGTGWMLKHHKVWIDNGNPTFDKKKYALVFIDGNRRNFDINNLKLVSRATLSRMSKARRWSDISSVNNSYLLLSEVETKLTSAEVDK